MTHRPPTTPATLCTECDHEVAEVCPLHGCPNCLLDIVPYDDTPLGPPLMPEDQEHAQELAEVLHESYIEGQGGTCLICDELVARSAAARYPGAACEMRDCLHCTACGACSRSARVCRSCRRCETHPVEPGMDMPDCERFLWSRALRRETSYFTHTYWDPITGRWGR